MYIQRATARGFCARSFLGSISITAVSWACIAAQQSSWPQLQLLVEYMTEVGAWVVLLRIFPMTLLRQFGGGGKRGARRLNRQPNLWDTGCYTAAAALPARPRAVRRSRQRQARR